MSGVKLGWKSEDQIHRETVAIPIVAGLVVVVVTVLGLYLFREGRAIRASLGTSRVTSGGKSVRRSKRHAPCTQLQATLRMSKGLWSGISPPPADISMVSG